GHHRCDGDLCCAARQLRAGQADRGPRAAVGPLGPAAMCHGSGTPRRRRAARGGSGDRRLAPRAARAYRLRADRLSNFPGKHFMAIKASEISDLIKQRIEGFKSVTEARNVGTIVSVTDGITRIHGLADARYGEMLEFPGNTFGLALNLEQDSVGAVVLGDYKHLREGDQVKTTNRILEVPV